MSDYYSKSMLKETKLNESKSRMLIYGNFDELITEESMKPDIDKMSYAAKWHHNSTQALRNADNKLNGNKDYSSKLRYYMS